MSEDKNKAQEELIEAKFSVLRRMEDIGWIHGFKRDGFDVEFHPTERGREIMREVERLFFHGSKAPNTTEMTAFCCIIKLVENL